MGKTIRFSHNPRNFTGTSLYNEWEYLKINMGIKNYSQKEIFGMELDEKFNLLRTLTQKYVVMTSI